MSIKIKGGKMEYISDDEYRQMAINDAKSKADNLEKRVEELTNLIKNIRYVLCDCDNCSKVNELKDRLVKYSKIEEQNTGEYAKLFNECMSYKEALEEIREDIHSFYVYEDSSNDYKLADIITKINEVLK